MPCQIEYKPQIIKATIALPSSKSISNRILILNALSGNNFPIDNLSDAGDTQLLNRILNSSETHFDIGNTGTAMRFLSAYFALKPGIWELTGSTAMLRRPLSHLVEALQTLGADILYLGEKGFPPIRIQGKELIGGKITIEGGMSSQFISALMMIGPLLKNGLTLEIVGTIVSKPYIQITLHLMQQYGAQVNASQRLISIEPGIYKTKAYTVESDWTSASYWYLITLLAPRGVEIALPGLEKKSIQGDRIVSRLFDRLGVATQFLKEGIVLTRDNHDVFFYDRMLLRDYPDLAQTMAVAYTLKKIPFNISGLENLSIKETDRVWAMMTELPKIGAKNLKLLRTGISCNEFRDFEPGYIPEIKTYGDHRMALAFSAASMVFGKIRLDRPEVVEKSYPGFWKDVEKIGIVMKHE